MLSTSGHIAALVNPPGNPKATFQVAAELPADPDEWLASATTHRGSWWPDWTAWATARAGVLADPPAELGSAQHPPLGAAPGTYVFVT